jgi:hypothetical protein
MALEATFDSERVADLWLTNGRYMRDSRPKLRSHVAENLARRPLKVWSIQTPSGKRCNHRCDGRDPRQPSRSRQGPSRPVVDGQWTVSGRPTTWPERVRAWPVPLARQARACPAALAPAPVRTPHTCRCPPLRLSANVQWQSTKFNPPSPPDFFHPPPGLTDRPPPARPGPHGPFRPMLAHWHCPARTMLTICLHLP